MAIIASLLLGSLLILMAGVNPLEAYGNLIRASYGCEGGQAVRCALLTAFEFAIPLMLSGLAATVCIRAGFFSLGQISQMALGGYTAFWIAGSFDLPPIIHPAAAMLGGALMGAAWAWIPAALKEWVGVNEIISTLLFNQFVTLVRLPFFGRGDSENALLPPLVPSTHFTAGVFIALAAAVWTWIYLWRTSSGFEHRMAGQAPGFASYGGIKPRRAVIQAVMISGALAGLGGAIVALQGTFLETRFDVAGADGLIAAFVGQLHPLGVAIAAVLVGGLRAGALMGLQIESQVPRELGGALIALMLIFAARASSSQPETNR